MKDEAGIDDKKQPVTKKNDFFPLKKPVFLSKKKRFFFGKKTFFLRKKPFFSVGFEHKKTKKT